MKRLYWLIGLVVLLSSCRETIVSDDPALQLTFSKDTVEFDTVFTSIGSSMQRLIVRNDNRNALRINKIWLDNGQYFKVNADGETTLANLTDMELHGGDSMYVFVRVYVNPQNSNSPVLIRDQLRFSVNGNVQTISLEAYGQDVELIRTKQHKTEYMDMCFSADKPYLIYDTVLVNQTLTFEAGAQLYMHQGASLLAFGNVEAYGTREAPIYIRGDRRDRLFDSVPYAYTAGMWDGFYCTNDKDKPMVKYIFENVNIESGNVGLYCQSERTTDIPYLEMNNCRIHNQALYGLVLQGIDAKVVNTEISNCASYCAYLAGGKHEFIHTTIASYFNATNLVALQSTPRKDVAAVYINNLSKQLPLTETSFFNCIVTGARRNQMVVATPFLQYYAGTFIGNYLKTDTLQIPNAHHNVYWQQESDTTAIFRNTYYKYGEYRYYDFRLDSLSPARGIGDSITAVEYPIDRVGTARTGSKPDAGCYQYTL
ncbi:MAG: hypothetical protein ACI30A_04925 [Paludibacteraceae bacterium]